MGIKIDYEQKKKSWELPIRAVIKKSSKREYEEGDRSKVWVRIPTLYTALLSDLCFDFPNLQKSDVFTHCIERGLSELYHRFEDEIMTLRVVRGRLRKKSIEMNDVQYMQMCIGSTINIESPNAYRICRLIPKDIATRISNMNEHLGITKKTIYLVSLAYALRSMSHDARHRKRFKEILESFKSSMLSEVRKIKAVDDAISGL